MLLDSYLFSLLAIHLITDQRNFLVIESIIHFLSFLTLAPPEIPTYWRGVKSRFGNQARDLRKSSGAVATVVKGANLNIKCAVVGNPKPTIKWTVATTGRQRRYTVLNDGTLEVPNADLEDEGNYTCIANNSYGILKRTTSVSILGNELTLCQTVFY